MADSPECAALKAKRGQLEQEKLRLDANPPLAEQLDQLNSLLKELQDITKAVGDDATSTAAKIKEKLEEARKRFPGIPKDFDRIHQFVDKYGKSLGEFKKFLDAYQEIVEQGAKAQLAFDEGQPADQIQAFADHIAFLRKKIPGDALKSIPGLGAYLEQLENGVRSFVAPVKKMQEARDTYDKVAKDLFDDKSIKLPTARERWAWKRQVLQGQIDALNEQISSVCGEDGQPCAECDECTKNRIARVDTAIAIAKRDPAVRAAAAEVASAAANYDTAVQAWWKALAKVNEADAKRSEIRVRVAGVTAEAYATPGDLHLYAKSSSTYKRLVAAIREAQRELKTAVEALGVAKSNLAQPAQALADAQVAHRKALDEALQRALEKADAAENWGDKEWEYLQRCHPDIAPRVTRPAKKKIGLRPLVPAAAVLLACLLAVGTIARGNAEFDPSEIGSPPTAEAEAERATGMPNCDCPNLSAGLLTKEYRRQCKDHEGALAVLAAKDELGLEAEGGKLVRGQFCDSVASGPDAWPVAGAPETASVAPPADAQCDRPSGLAREC